MQKLEDVNTEDSGEENELEPQEKSPQEEEGEAASSADDSISVDSEPMEPSVPVQVEKSASELEAALPHGVARKQTTPRPSFF